MTQHAILLLLTLGPILWTAGCQQKQPQAHQHGANGGTAAEHHDHRDIPTPVAAALERQSPGAKVTKFHTHPRPDGSKRWHLHYVTPDGKEDDASFEATGATVE